MLDVLSRSQRSRVCEYTRNEKKLTTPAMIGSAESDVWIEVKGMDRYFTSWVPTLSWNPGSGRHPIRM